MNHRRLMNWLFLATGWSLLVAPSTISAQQIGMGRSNKEQTTNIFLPAPRSLRQQLSRARKALADERYSEAVDRLGQLLASPESAADTLDHDNIGEQDYFLTDSDAPGTQVSLKTEAQRLLGAMPEKGRDLYELKFGAEARQLLDRAMRDRDFQQLFDVTRRYFHTNAGYEATMLIGRHDLDRGRPLAAALRFQRLESSPFAVERYDPELSVLLATCWLMAEMPERARATLVRLRKRNDQATIRIGAKEVSLFDNEENALAWLNQLIGTGLLSRGHEVTEWVVYRGDTARNAESSGGLPLLTARWRVPAANHPTDEGLIRQRAAAYRDQGIAALPGLHPLAVAGVILMRTPRRLFAVDLETGKRVWPFPWIEAPNEQELQNDLARPPRRIQNPRSVELDRRVWDDAPFGQMSSDGRQVFFIWGLRPQSAVARQVVIQFGGRQTPAGPSNHNKLVALDLKAEGKLRWIVGDEDGTDEPRLAGAFFLGPPLPLMGQLYVMAEINSEIRLVVLDAESGRLEWSQQLAHVDMREITRSPTRRAAGASPSFADGVLVCPTSAGAVVAVDLSTRSLLWGYQYPHAGTLRRHSFGYYPVLEKQIGQRWSDATVTVADGRVLLTPVESDRLYCLDLLSGKPLWKPIPRADMLYTGCVAKGKAIMVGGKQVRAISLADGSTAWTTPLEVGMPSGRGVLTGAEYLLPTTERHLLKIDIESGAIVQDIETDQILGNLVAHQDQLISHGVEWLSAFYQTEPLRAKIATRLREHPDDAWALARRGELLLYDGKHSEAIAVFQRAHQLDPDDDAIRSSLVKSLLVALRDDFQGYRELAVTLEDLVDQPRQKAEFYHLMAVGLEQEGKLGQAVEFFVKLAGVDVAAASGADGQPNGLFRIDSQRRIRRDRWIRSHLAQLMVRADQPARQRIDQIISAHFDDVMKSQSVGQLRQFIDYFGSHPLGVQGQFELAQRLIRNGTLLDAEMQLVQIAEGVDPALAATATATLAELLLKYDKPTEAADCYKRLATQWKETVTLNGQTGGEIAAAARSDGLLAANGQRVEWPRGKCDVTKQARGSNSYRRNYPITLNDITGPFPRDTMMVFNQNQRSIEVRDRFGRVVQQVLLGDGTRFVGSAAPACQGSAFGHLVVLNIGTEAVAVDTLPKTARSGNPVRWRRDLSSTLAPPTNRSRSLTAKAISRTWGPPRYVIGESQRGPLGGLGPVTSSGVFFQKMQELICADPLTGETIWTRAGLEPGCDIFGDETHLFVVPSGSDEALVVRSSDGADLGTRTVPVTADRWVTRGRFVLSCRIEKKQLIMRWTDAWKGDDVWQRVFDMHSKCWMPAQDEVAVMEPSGNFIVLQLSDGVARVESRLDPEPHLSQLLVLRSQDRYLVVANATSSSQYPSSRSRYAGILASALCQQINGHIYAVDRKNGKSLWPVPATVRNYYLPLDQPPASPVLMFLNHEQTQASANSPRVSFTGLLLCMDRRDGRQLLSEKISTTIRDFGMEAVPDSQTVQVNLNKERFLLKFTSDPVPPEPPIQMSEVKRPDDTLQRVGKIAGAILEALAEQKASSDAAKKKKPDPNGTPEKKDPKKKAAPNGAAKPVTGGAKDK